MSEQQTPVTPPAASPLSTPPPSLQLLQTDAEAGLCVDGYCVLPSAPAASTD
jgi:hypothetical protein